MSTKVVKKKLTDLPTYAPTTDSAGVLHYRENAADYQLPITSLITATQLIQSTGLQYIGQCLTVATLRTINFSAVGQQIFVAEHTSGMGQGGGIFYCHALTNTGSLVDDNGFQIINNYGQVIRRKDRNILSAEMFGAIGGADIKPVLDNMFLASRTFNIQEAVVPEPANKIAYLHSGGSLFNIDDGIGFNLRGITVVNKGVPINHIGNNICFRFYKTTATTSFYEQSSITGFLIRGRTSDNSASGNTGIGLQISDIIGFHVDVFINGYTSTTGAAISVYNDTGFTEQSRIRAHIRACCNGVIFHRNAASGATSTNSFMGTELDLAYQAGVGGAVNKGIVVGNIDGTATTNTFDINLYATKIKMKYWAEAGSSTTAIYVGAKALVPESTTVNMISDGYGFGTSDSETTTTEATRLIRVENGGIFRAKCLDQSSQTGINYRLNQIQRLRNTIFSYQDDTYKIPYTDARPYINPKGMKISCYGTLDVATQRAGNSWQISGLPMGMRLRVTIAQYLESEAAISITESWTVIVRGDAQSVMCVPEYSTDVMTTTTSAALTNTSGTTAQFVTAVTAGLPRYWQGDGTRTRLTVRNNNNDNALTTGSSDGRKFRIYLPANASATSILHYSVEIEII